MTISTDISEIKKDIQSIKKSKCVRCELRIRKIENFLEKELNFIPESRNRFKEIK